jgi:DNA polymerase-3 subunit epsilon
MWTIQSASRATMPFMTPSKRVAAYVDHLDAALVDGYLASFERNKLAAVAAQLGLSATRLDHVHRGYFIALAVTAWADMQITFDEEAQLTMVAVALSIPIPEAIELVVTARDIEPPLLVSGLGLTPRDRIAFADPLGTDAVRWCERASAAGLTPTPDVQSARYIVTSDPNAGKHDVLWEAGSMVIAEWAFDVAVERLEEQRRQRGLVL